MDVENIKTQTGGIYRETELISTRDLKSEREGSATKKRVDGADEFVGIPLTEEQREKLGINEYYRPYTMDSENLKNKKTAYRACKRFLDIVFSIIALVSLSPIILIFMLAIFLEDPSGSPIFKQQRIGKDCKPFTFYKLRSMHKDAENQISNLVTQNKLQDKAFKIKCDSRITKVGKIIRNTSIDELPQLINVIMGDMSIVGPRPPLPREVEKYDDYDKQRLVVTPGLTCFWQTFPSRHEISFEDWVALDIKYAENRGLLTDLKIVLKTVAVVFSGAGD